MERAERSDRRPPQICTALDCQIGDIMEIVPDENKPKEGSEAQ